MNLLAIKKGILVSLGSLFVVAGLFFLLIPVIPGLLVGFLGLNLLAKGSNKIKNNKLYNKYINYLNKYMNSIIKLLKTRTKQIAVMAIVLTVVVSSLGLSIEVAQASTGVDSSFKQVKTADSAVVYYLDHARGMKKAYVNEISYLAYGNNWSDVKIVSQEVLDSFSDVRLVKAANDSKVYYIKNGQKAWVQTEADFASYGFSWDSIVTIAAADSNTYETVDLSTLYAGGGINNESTLNLEVSNYNPSASRIPVNTKDNLMAVFKIIPQADRVEINKLIINLKGIFNSDVVEDVYLVIDDAKYEKSARNGKEIEFNFNNSPLTIWPYYNKELKVYVDLADLAEANNQTIKISISEQSDIETSALVLGNFPLEGNTHTLVYANDVLGQVSVNEISLERTNEAIIGNTDQELAKFEISEITKTEDLLIEEIRLKNYGTAAQDDLVDYVLVDENNNKVSQVEASVGYKEIVFKLNDYKIQKGKSKTFTVLANIVNGEDRTVNIQFDDAVIKGADYGFSLGVDSTNLDESITIIRKELGVISQDLEVSKNLNAEQKGALLGVYEIRNNNQEITLKSVLVDLVLSETAPNFEGNIYMVNYDTGEILNSINAMTEDRTFDFPNTALEAKDTLTIAFIGDVPDSAKQGDKYKTVLKEVTYQFADSNYHIDEVNVNGETLTVSRANAYIFENIEEQDPSYTKGEEKVKIASFYIESANGDDLKINALTFSKGNTSGLVTYDNGFSNLKAYIGGKKVGATIEEPFKDTYTFTGFTYKLKAGKRVEVKLYADTANDLKVSETEIMLSNMVAVSYNSGIEATITGLNTKSYKVNFGTVSAALEELGGGNIGSGEDEYKIASFEVTNTGAEDIRLKTLSIISSGSELSYSRGYKNLKIVEREDSKRVGRVSKPVAGANKIKLSYKLEAGETKTFDVYVELTENAITDDFELYFSNLEVQGYDSKIYANATGAPTGSVGVGGDMNYQPSIDDDNNFNSGDDNSNTSVELNMQWPVGDEDDVTYGFEDPKYLEDFGTNHEAIDIELDEGDVVRAAEAGTVIEVLDDSSNDGTPNVADNCSYVVIRHDGTDVRTVYAHLSEINVSVNDTVTKNTAIGLGGGEIGEFGSGPNTSGAHLHFEVRVKDGNSYKAVDPMDYLD